jgi:N-acetylneuraminate synthase
MHNKKMDIFISAEIGINHNGDLDICKKLIDIAKDSGCDAVKFQKRDIETVYDSKLLDTFRESPWGNTQRAQKVGLEFGLEEYSEINSYCKNKDIEWYASAWDLKSLEFLKNFNCKYNKIASAMLTSEKFLNAVADEKKYTFISTGMSNFDEIDTAIKIFKEKKCPYELMHTVSTYPMEPSDANLNVINTLKSRYQCKVGYSGHETGVAISCAAAAFGISSLERHITLDRSMYGSDQSASLEPRGLRELIGSVRKIEQALGDGIKKFLPAEEKVSEKLRAHLSNI